MAVALRVVVLGILGMRFDALQLPKHQAGAEVHTAAQLNWAVMCVGRGSTSGQACCGMLSPFALRACLR